MKIVSNTSPIIFLSKLRILDLVQKQYKKILIPEAVFKELTYDDKYIENIEYVRSFHDLFQIEKSINADKFDFELHKGEKEAIVLAIENRAELIFLDDYSARMIARIYKIKVLGTLGILIQFLKGNMINYNKFEKLLQKLISDKFRIDIELYNYILNYAKQFKK
ncbi:hypothetical protein JXB41_02845 [Candidatus Woesearchaeota archaeon]|nr:hypothetical protein [Candidatus Woesearchaeota archaeon]